MISFDIAKKSAHSNARLGTLTTPHGVIETPAFVPVATQAVVKTLTSEEVLETGAQLLIANTFHLHLKPGEQIVAAGGGLHEFMRWPKPLMTDSGGFQVFSLGFGRDLGVGKILKTRRDVDVGVGRQPQAVTITDDGVEFTSPLDGTKLFLGPKESMEIQQKLGADIIFAFDECTPPTADADYTAQSLLKTHRWAQLCLSYKTSDQALYGIVQGGKFKELREQSARAIAALPFDGFGIGGEFGDNKATMTTMLRHTLTELPAEKPRHLLGIGHLEDIEPIIKAGVDTFDCIVPTHYARHGVAFTSAGKLDLSKAPFRADHRPLDEQSAYPLARTYTRSYLAHLLRANEITALRILTTNNLIFFHEYVASLRAHIKAGKL